MFRCSTCRAKVPPKVKPHIVPKEERTRQYNFYDAEDNPVMKMGTEIVSELMLCPGCAGASEVMPPIVDTKASYGLGLAMQAHARKCNKKLDECFVCQRAVTTTYVSISAPVINRVLTEAPVHTGRLSIAELTITAMMERTKHKSKRASDDFLAAFPILKAYEQRGGKL